MVKTFSKAIAFITLVTAGFANAVPVTSLSGSTTYVFESLNYVGNAAQTVAPGITWTAENEESLYGYTDGYGFGTNGDWFYELSMIGTNDASSTMSITFDEAVSGVGAFFNYNPQFGASSISIYGAGNTLLESFALNFEVYGENTGEFHGFLRDTADIFRFDFTGGYIGAANLEVVAGVKAPVEASEPSVTLLLGLALLGLGLIRRKAAK